MSDEQSSSVPWPHPSEYVVYDPDAENEQRQPTADSGPNRTAPSQGSGAAQLPTLARGRVADIATPASQSATASLNAAQEGIPTLDEVLDKNFDVGALPFRLRLSLAIGCTTDKFNILSDARQSRVHDLLSMVFYEPQAWEDYLRSRASGRPSSLDFTLFSIAELRYAIRLLQREIRKFNLSRPENSELAPRVDKMLKAINKLWPWGHGDLYRTLPYQR